MFLRLLVTLTTSSSRGWAACPMDAPTLHAQVESGLIAYANWDWPAFDDQLDAVRAGVSCLSETPSPAEIAQLHRLIALGAGREKKPDQMQAAWRGVLSIEPTWEPPEELAAAGSVQRETFVVARALGGGATREVFITLNVDGRPATQLPLERATLVTLRTDNGLQSWYLHGDGALPPALTLALQAPKTAPNIDIAEVDSPVQTARGLPLALTAAAVGAASAASFALAHNTWSSYEDDPNEANILLNHASVIGGYALATTAGALSVGAVIRWRR